MRDLGKKTSLLARDSLIFCPARITNRLPNALVLSRDQNFNILLDTPPASKPSSLLTMVYREIQKNGKPGSIDDAQRSGQNAILCEDDRNFIDEKMKDNDELTSWELQKLLRDEQGVTISTSTIRNVRRKLGWKHEKA